MSAGHGEKYRMIPASGGGARVLCLVCLPPPFTGRTIATRRFLTRFSTFSNLEIRDLGSDSKRDVGYRIGKALSSVRAMARLLVSRRRRFDCIYIVANHGAGLWLDIGLALAARLRGWPMVVHHHVFSYLNRRKLSAAILFGVTGRDSFHLMLCDCMADLCRNVYRTRSSLRAIPNFARDDDGELSVVREPEELGDSLNLIFLSNLTHEKGLGNVLRLARHYRGHHNVRIRLAGPAMSESVCVDIRRCVNEPGSVVDWCGQVDSKQRAELLQDSDLFLFPTRYPNEAQPLVVLEAQSAGIPVIANARGCIGEMVDDESGQLVEDERQFVESAIGMVDRMLADRRYRTGLRDGAIRRARIHERAAQDALARLASEIESHAT